MQLSHKYRGFMGSNVSISGHTYTFNGGSNGAILCQFENCSFAACVLGFGDEWGAIKSPFLPVGCYYRFNNCNILMQH